ncbi:MAG: FAD-binding oxidoreductase [Patescibacteria group bacterium]
MENLKSPWVHQIVRSRPIYMLQTDLVCDICIVGGGISGIMSAYQILKNTRRNVVIIDSHEIGHGATGHNAGQLVDELERSVASLVEEFGLEKTIEGLRSVHSGWAILEEIVQEAKLSIPYSTFEGYSMYSTKKQIFDQLLDISLMHQGGMQPKKMYISEQHVHTLSIPDMYSEYYQVIPHESVLSIGETKNPTYIAAFPSKRGCLNSALLVEQLATYLTETYSVDRCKIYENTLVNVIDLDTGSIAIHIGLNNKTICAETLLLCTNGFEHFTINDLTQKINHSFHKNVKGVIGYMLAQTEEIDHIPSAFSYCDPSYDIIAPDVLTAGINTSRDIAYAGDYVYTTRRPYDIGHEEPKNLFCLGGKARVVEDSTTYLKSHIYLPAIKREYEDFIASNFNSKKDEAGHREFVWHGLMGYTRNGVRMVGFEKKNSLLMYNLGCNGVGILPAVWSGKRIANLLLGDKTISMFDPK